jgi:hypothetical protein
MVIAWLTVCFVVIEVGKCDDPYPPLRVEVSKPFDTVTRYFRGDMLILRVIEADGNNGGERSIHNAIYFGDAERAAFVRSWRQGQYRGWSTGTCGHIMEDDVDLDGKMDLLVIQSLGSEPIIEYFEWRGDRLYPIPSAMLNEARRLETLRHKDGTLPRVNVVAGLLARKRGLKAGQMNSLDDMDLPDYSTLGDDEFKSVTKIDE